MAIAIGSVYPQLNYQAKIASKIAFQASMEKAQLNQQYWDELLKKLRRSGGGGSDPKFDRIKVSMQLMNFLSNKNIQAMLRNFNFEFLKLPSNSFNPHHGINQNVFVLGLQKFSNVIFNNITNMILLIVRRDAPLGRLYGAANRLVFGIESFIFQFNKLKEILEQEFKETIRKLDVKEELKKIKTVILDFFVEMREEVLGVTDFLKLQVKNRKNSTDYISLRG